MNRERDDACGADGARSGQGRVRGARDRAVRAASCPRVCEHRAAGCVEADGRLPSQGLRLPLRAVLLLPRRSTFRGSGARRVRRAGAVPVPHPRRADGGYFRETATGRARAGRVIPEPFFVHSDLTTAIRLADLVACVVAWGFPFGTMRAPARPELAGLADLVAQLRYPTTREDADGVTHPVWSFTLIEDLRPRSERPGAVSSGSEWRKGNAAETAKPPPTRIRTGSAVSTAQSPSPGESGGIAFRIRPRLPRLGPGICAERRTASGSAPASVGSGWRARGGAARRRSSTRRLAPALKKSP